MFVDEAKISVSAGKGGDGCVHFHRAKYVPKGGPDGGNGGRGGDVIFHAVNNLHTLSDFRNQKEHKAENGQPGDQCDRTGRNGKDLIIKVPVGTIVREHGRVVADLHEENQMVLVAQGGEGGKGNAGFVNSIRQAPRFAEKGDLGDHLDLELELKLVADVALVGYPSVGKSTFISVVSNAKPKIAEYHFTTLVPNLGVAHIRDRDLVFVDVPGLIEEAHTGKGLGHTFLRHIERARYVLQLIDVSSDTPLQDFEIIRSELEKFSEKLAKKPFLPVFAKIDLVDDEYLAWIMEEFEAKFGIKPQAVSAATHQGMDDLLKWLIHELPEEYDYELEETPEETVLFRPGEKEDGRRVVIEQKENWWSLSNTRLEQISRQTNWDSVEAQERVYDVLRKWGTTKELERVGAVPGDKLKIGEGIIVYRG